MNYTRANIISMCENACSNMSEFYQQKFINYRGKTSDTDELYTEVIAEYLLSHLEEFINGITVIHRERGYDAKHEGIFREGTGRDEEVTAIKMFNESKDGVNYAFIGRIIDYQTPLKASSKDKAGKIDLLSYAGNVLYVLELKKKDSDETMLRCVLEGYTYLKTVDEAKLLADFKLPEDTVIKASPFVFREGEQYKEWKENRPMLCKLMESLDSKPFFINEIDGKYAVTED